MTQTGRIVQRGTAAHYLMMNKPAGILSATTDPSHTTVIDILDTPDSGALHIAGRLDRASTGLLILTNNGVWSRHLTDPHRKKPKVYRVGTARPITPETVLRFADGIWFEYEQLRTSPAELELLGPSLAQVTIYEGRYHQIKRMFQAVGNRVTSLHREQMGPITLDIDLAPGGYRPLTHPEIRAVTDEATDR
ncbi:MAG TPA: 16S rRNA pseudouridine(516) synthase [Desulfurivibrionaceae bacterium]|nr:16S rRNA pseudouridine(516) synthase [Desulfurivibrionaceae bacterium]